MPRQIAVLVTIGGLLGGCTTFVPVPHDGGTTWQEARHAPYQPGTSRVDAKQASPGASAPTIVAAPLPPQTGPDSFDPRPLPPLGTAEASSVALEDQAGGAWSVDARGYEVPVVAAAPVRDVPVVEAPARAPETRAAVPPTPSPAATPAPKPVAPAPVVAEAAPQRAQPSVTGVADAARQGADLAPPALSNVGFLWPVEGEIRDASSPNSPAHLANGLLIRAPAGEPFVAAENGVVVFAGDDVATYGTLVVVRHDGDYTTAYGHAQRVDVAKGDVVRRGQRLGLVGSTGAADAPGLYFEMRVGNQVIDPRHYLMGSPKVAAN